MVVTKRQRLTAPVVVIADAVVLRTCWPAPAALASHVAHPRLWAATDGADAAAGELARTGLWLCAAWLALALVSVLASRFPGLIGRAGAAVAARAVPAFLRGGVAAAIGASVVLTPLAAGASPAGGHSGSPAVSTSTTAGAAHSRAAALSDGWPWPASTQTTTAGQTTANHGTTSNRPSTSQPTPSPTKTTSQPTPSPTRTTSQATPSRTTPSRTTASGTTTGAPGTPVPWPHSSTPQRSSDDVVVKSGDCLWAIAAHRLGPQASTHDIALESHRWYDANTATIGADPGLIHPGQHLHHPTEKGPRS